MQSSQRNRRLREALALAAVFAAIKLALHVGTDLLQAHLGWGYFRDEMYYLMCGRHLAFGYVDQGPVVALQARAAELLFGHSLAGIRFFAALAGAGTVFLTGIFCYVFGAGRGAQALAMTAVLLCPQYLGGDSYLSMNSFEAPLWGLALLAVLVLTRGGSGRWWLLFGVAAGIGLENKPSMTFFLFALLLALLVTPQRRILYSGYAAAGIAVMIAVAAPNLIWQATHHWPTWEFLHNGRVENKNVALNPPMFLLRQIFITAPLTAWLWVTGVVIALARRELRWLGITYLVFLGIMMALHAKDYYVTPIYPALIALGCAARWDTAPAGAGWFRRWRRPMFATLLVIGGVLVIPAAIPVFRVDQEIAYLDRMHMHVRGTENTDEGPLPQFFADRFGWQEEADAVKAAYDSLSPADKEICGVFAGNYGEASAINWLLPKGSVPVAVSGHNAYWTWGPNGYTGDCMIEVLADKWTSLKDMQDSYEQVTVAGHIDNPYAMPYEKRTIYIVHRRKGGNFLAAWPEMKHYI